MSSTGFWGVVLHSDDKTIESRKGPNGVDRRSHMVGPLFSPAIVASENVWSVL